MSDEEDYNSEEDLDYIPSDGEQVSEEEHSGEEEDLSLLQDGEAEVKTGSKSARRKGSGKKTTTIIEARKRRGGIKLDNGNEDDTTAAHMSSKEGEDVEEAKRKEDLAKQIQEEQEKKKEEKEKKRADDLWSSFMADVKKPTPRTPQSAPSGAGLGSLSSQAKPSPRNNVKESTPCSNSADKTSKVTITKVFDFAGEEIKITKEVDADSKEGKAEQRKQEKLDKGKEETDESKTISDGGTSIPFGMKRPAVGGLGSVLNKISKKNKMGTLEKSKLDWNSFKQKEGIEEDLKIHNKGKQGYTERMAFLNRADHRQFEIERDVRLGKNSKR